MLQNLLPEAECIFKILQSSGFAAVFGGEVFLVEASIFS